MDYNPFLLSKKLYQKSIWSSVSSVAHDIKTYAPIVVELDLTSSCNLLCPECISKSIRNRGDFSLKRISDLIKEFSELGVKAVILTGGGEPLLHPHFDAVMEQLADSKILIGVNTNGTHIHLHMESLSLFASWVRVSVDAATANTHSVFRPNASGDDFFSRVIKSMQQLATNKAGKLGYSYLLLNRFNQSGRLVAHNYNEIYDAGRKAKDIGCDYLEIKPMFTHDHYILRTAPYLFDLLSRQLAKLVDIEDDVFHVFQSVSLFSQLRGGAIDEAKLNKHSVLFEYMNFRRCLISQLRTLVTPYGIYICPYYRGIESKCFGNPKIEAFREIWNGPKREEVLNDTRPDLECKFHCIRNTSNLELLKIGENSEEPIVEDYDLFI